MSERNWFSDVVRQITTPIGLVATFSISLTMVSRGISFDTFGAAGVGLLWGIEALFAFLIVASIGLVIFGPKNLTFDKDAHIAVDVKAHDALDFLIDARDVDDLLADLMAAKDDPKRLEEMAEKIRRLDPATRRIPAQRSTSSAEPHLGPR
jgi:hypothetical protein